MAQKRTTPKPWYRRLEQRLPAPARLEWAMIGIGAVVFLITLIAGQLTRPYGSDDVITQNILQSWREGLTLRANAGADNFVLKAPFFLLEDLLIPHNSRLKLFILVLVFAAILYVCMIVFLRHFIPERERRGSRLTVFLAFLPIVWYFGLTALPHPNSTFVDISWVTNFFKINLRNAELGAALLFLLPFARYLRDKQYLQTRRQLLFGGLLAVAMGLFWFNDPYFLFTLGGGVVIALTILWVTKQLSNRQLLDAAGFGAVSLIVYKLLPHLFAHAGYIAGGLGNFSFPTFANLSVSLTNTGEGIFKMFNADFWGFGVMSQHAKIFMINGLLVLLCTAGVVYGIARLRQAFDVLRLLVLSVMFATLAAYCFSLNGNDASQSRYVMLAVLCSLVLLADWLVTLARSPRWQRLVLLIVLASTAGVLLNVAVNARLIQGAISSSTAPNDINYKIIHIAEANGVSKGYADYWDSNIDTYLADRDVVMIPINCGGGTIARYTWLYNFSDYDSIHADKTFFLTTHERLGNSNGYCGDLMAPFGSPTKVIKISNSYTMYIYDKDIGPAIQFP